MMTTRGPIVTDVIIGTITITEYLDEDGDIITGVSVDGDIPLVTQLGLLRMAEDTILNCNDEDEEDD